MMNALLLSLSLLVQDAPDLGSSWANSRELKLENLKGKVVALYFFEEG